MITAIITSLIIITIITRHIFTIGLFCSTSGASCLPNAAESQLGYSGFTTTIIFISTTSDYLLKVCLKNAALLLIVSP